MSTLVKTAKFETQFNGINRITTSFLLLVSCLSGKRDDKTREPRSNVTGSVHFENTFPIFMCRLSDFSIHKTWSKLKNSDVRPLASFSGVSKVLLDF